MILPNSLYQCLFIFCFIASVYSSISNSFAELRRTFEFSNGASVVYVIDEKNHPSDYRVEFVTPSNEQQNNPLLHQGRGLTYFETNQDRLHWESFQITTPYPTTNSARISTDSNSTFTWFQDSGTRKVIFQDGTIRLPCSNKAVYEEMWEKFVVKSFDHNGNQYSIESHLSKEGTATTFLYRQSDLNCTPLDSTFHPIINEHIQDSVLSIQDVEAQVTLSNLCVNWPITEQQDIFWLHSCEYAGELQNGTSLIRLSDNSTIKIDSKPLSFLPNSGLPYSIKDGILTFSTHTPEKKSSELLKNREGTSFRMNFKLDSPPFELDLREFDAEQRKISQLVKGGVVFDKNQQPINVVDEMKNYPELVAHSKNYKEKADPSIIESIALAIISNKSAVILGKPGIGKTSAVKAFAREVSQGKVKGVPRTTKIFQIEMAKLASGTQFAGTIQQKLSILIEAAKELGCIYFIDEIHSTAGIGTSSHQSNDITQYIKEPIETGSMLIIGTDTEHEFINTFSSDPAFMERFEQIKLTPPIGDELEALIKGNIENKYNVVADQTIVKQAIELSNDLDLLLSQPRAAVNLLKVAAGLTFQKRSKDQRITAQTLHEAAITKYKIDPSHFSRSLVRARFLNLTQGLEEHLIGQEAAKKAIISVWKRKLTGVGDSEQINSVLLVGPPSVGKRKLAEVSANLMGYEKTIIEMTKYPPGSMDQFRREIYVDLLKSPFRVIILNNLEKAHISLQDAALSMLQTGKFIVVEKVSNEKTVSREVNTSKALFILTTNAASQWIKDKQLDANITDKLISGGISEAIVSRIQYIAPVSNPDEKEFTLAITKFLENTLAREGKKQGVTFHLDNKESFIKKMSDQYQKTCNFQDARRIMLEIEEYISDAIINTDFEPGTTIDLKWNKNFEPQIKKDSVNPYDHLYT